MKLLKEGNRDVRLHPEVREKFHELLRFHFSAFRRGKDVHEVRRDMRARDVAEQAALLKGNCEMDIVVTHEKACQSRVGGFMWSMPCDCTPTREVKFSAPMPPLNFGRLQDAINSLYVPWHSEDEEDDKP